MAAREALSRGQSVEEYLGTLLADALARRDIEELPDGQPLVRDGALKGHRKANTEEGEHKVRPYGQSEGT